jgi:hypothetical protein
MKMNIKDDFIFPQFNFIKEPISSQLDYAEKIIYDTQKNATRNQECYMSFYPIAKNIRFVSSHFYNAILNGNKPILSDNCRIGEDYFWLEMTGHSWYPWLWIRYHENIETHERNRKSWKRIFKSIEDTKKNEYTGIVHTNSFYLYLACLSHIFRLDENFENYLVETYKVNLPDEPVCGLQIRRGEIVPQDGDIDKAWNIRKLYTIDEYMSAAKLVCDSLGTKSIFLSSDSSETISYLRDNYPDYSFYVNKYDRNKFLRFQGDSGKVNLERDLQLNPKLIKHYTESCLIDLYVLARCHGYVGGMKYSEYGVCGWFLQMINQRAITPYFNIEGEFDLQGSPVGLLLN